MAAAAFAAPGAVADDNFDAAYRAAECYTTGGLDNTPLLGRGASFQRLAQQAWGADIVADPPSSFFDTSNNEGSSSGFGNTVGACSAFAARTGIHELQYQPLGSGAGRTAFAVSDTAGAARNADIAYGGTDEGPTAGQLANANRGPLTASTADDDELHTIPVAQSSVAVAFRIPNGCSISNSSDRTGPFRRISRLALEGFFAGSTSFDQWSELVPAITGTNCGTLRPARVVRLDSSGTTFQFKRYLQEVSQNLGGTRTWWAETDNPGTVPVDPLANNAWPAAVVRGARNGNGPLLDELAAQSTNGGIGYGDVATARARGYGWDGTAGDTQVWAYAQRLGDTAYRSPATDNAQAGTLGSNCDGVTYTNLPAGVGGDETLGPWFDVTGVLTTNDYPLCTLTYALAWSNPETKAFSQVAGRGNWNQARADAVKSYLNYAINGGQAVLANNDYEDLPSAIQLIAQDGVNDLGY